jgi:hypothetical protein
MGDLDFTVADSTADLATGHLVDAGLPVGGRWAVSTVAPVAASIHSTVEDSMATRAAAGAASTVEEGSTVAAVFTEADIDKFFDSSTPHTAGSTLCRPFPFWFGLGAKPATRNAFVVAT